MKTRLFFLSACLVLALGTFWSACAPETGSVTGNYRSFKDSKALQKYMRWHKNREPLISAHRGGPMTGFPGNALATFENAMKYGPCLIECDVRMSKDGHLIMMHDDTLDRTTTGSGKVSEHTLSQLKQLYLKDPANNRSGYRVNGQPGHRINGQPGHRVPTFGEVLEWAKTRAVLTVDVKRNIPFEEVIREIREHKAQGHAIIITYNLKDLKRVHQLAPELMISGPANGIKGVEKLLTCSVPTELLCAFVGVSEPDPAVFQALHKKGIRAILGTMHNLDNKAGARGVNVYRKLFQNGADILATDNVRGVSEAIYKKKI